MRHAPTPSHSHGPSHTAYFSTLQTRLTRTFSIRSEFADCIAKGQHWDFSQDNIPEFRQNLLHNIITSGIRQGLLTGG